MNPPAHLHDAERLDCALTGRMVQAKTGHQHLATVIQHGIENFEDGPWAFVVPAIVNNYYRRWWWPLKEENGINHDPGNPLPWTGNYFDGFGNRITMHAYANSASDQAPEVVESAGGGYGLIRFDKVAQTVTFECWPRLVDVTQPGASQYTGWPVTIRWINDGYTKISY